MGERRGGERDGGGGKVRNSVTYQLRYCVGAQQYYISIAINVNVMWVLLVSFRADRSWCALCQSTVPALKRSGRWTVQLSFWTEVSFPSTCHALTLFPPPPPTHTSPVQFSLWTEVTFPQHLSCSDRDLPSTPTPQPPPSPSPSFPTEGQKEN